MIIIIIIAGNDQSFPAGLFNILFRVFHIADKHIYHYVL